MTSEKTYGLVKDGAKSVRGTVTQYDITDGFHLRNNAEKCPVARFLQRTFGVESVNVKVWLDGKSYVRLGDGRSVALTMGGTSLTHYNKLMSGEYDDQEPFHVSFKAEWHDYEVIRF